MLSFLNDTHAEMTSQSPLLPELIQQCDKALNACDASNQGKNTLLEHQKTLLLEQSRQLEMLKKDQESWQRNPLLWFVGGMLVTGATVYLVKPAAR